MYQINTPRASELAEFFNDPLSDLTANGLKMTAEGDVLSFGEDVLRFLRANRTADDDGCISDDASGLVMWVEGDGLMIATAD